MDLQVSRFLAAQAIMLSIVGVPGIYFHSLFGSRGWTQGVKQTGRNRTINREKLPFDELQSQLADETSLRFKVFSRYSRLLKARSDSPAFHPHGTQIIHDLHPAVFAVERISPDGETRMLCLHNVSRNNISISMKDRPSIALDPYQVSWIRSFRGIS
jgi:sucrose phosphorylase